MKKIDRNLSVKRIEIAIREKFEKLIKKKILIFWTFKTIAELWHRLSFETSSVTTLCTLCIIIYMSSNKINRINRRLTNVLT